MQRNLVPILGLIGLAVLCLLCIQCHGPRIQEDLTERGRAGLRAAGFDPAMLTLDGREARLSGSVNSPEAHREAERIVLATDGVRHVDNHLTVGSGTVAEVEGPVSKLALVRSGESMTLRGRVPSEEVRQKLIEAARGIWGDEQVADQLTADPAINVTEWLDGLPEALRVFEQRTENGSFDVANSQLTVGGRVFAEKVRQDLLARLGSLLPGLGIEDRLDVRPPVGTEELQETLNTAIVDRSVEFETNSAELTAMGRAVLDEIFELLSSQPAVRIGIAGHTDSQGAVEYNLQLSQLRSQAAKDYLVAKGLAADRFETSGFGGSRPVADNATQEGRRKNRRIEFQVLEDS